MGAEPTCGIAEDFTVSGERGCRLSMLRLDCFAPAEKGRSRPWIRECYRLGHAKIALSGPVTLCVPLPDLPSFLRRDGSGQRRAP